MLYKLTVTLILIILCNGAKSVYTEEGTYAKQEKNTHEGHYLIIRRTHRLQKRDSFGRDSYPHPVGVRSNEETIIILPNGGVNSPFNAYPSSGYGSNGANGGTTVIVKSTDNNYNGYGEKSYGGIPYKYG